MVAIVCHVARQAGALRIQRIVRGWLVRTCGIVIPNSAVEVRVFGVFPPHAYQHMDMGG